MDAAEPISVRRITTGVVRERRRSRGALRYLIDDWEDEVLPVNAYLVEHPRGRCLFDTGQTAKATAAGYLPGWHPFLRLARFELVRADEVGAQLEGDGVAPESIEHVVLSHLHTDHVGGVASFPRAELVVSEAEWRRARGLGGRLRGYVLRDWPADARLRAITFYGPAFGPFARSFDLLGDGTLLVVPTPGHTPGHLSLVVSGSTQTWLLAGDVVHSARELTDRYPAIARWCAAESVEVLTAHDHAASDGAGL